MTDAEKLLQLKEKYNSLKQANKVLKEGLLEKQDTCARLEQQLKEKDATLREQLEEIDHLQFQNGRVTKQLGTVTTQLEEQKQRQSSQSGWSVGGLGLISGKQQQEAVQKAEELKALQSELMMKIQENEDLHIQLFEAKKHHEEELERLRGEASTTSAELETRASDLAAERKKSGGLLEETQRQMSEIQRLSDECVAGNALADSLRSSLESSRRDSGARIGALEARLRRLQPFDEDQHDTWTAYSTSSRQGRDLCRRQKAADQLRTSVAEACRQGGEVLRSWASTFGGGGDGESGARLRMRNRMSEKVETLAKMVQEQLPGLIGHIDLVHLVPTAEWDRQLGDTSKGLLALHRKWVVYQSLLLLHDWNSAYAARSAQEEAQALRFVDWLWRLHRCLRGLFLRLRLLACAHALSASAASAAHFALASAAVRPGALGAEEGLEAHPAAGPGGAAASGAPASASASPSAAKRQPRAAGAGAAAQAGGEAATRLVLALRRSLQDIAQCWESIGRCLSAWASSQANPSGADLARPDRGSAVELIELVHRFNGCLADRALPAVAQALERLPRRLSGDDPAASARLAPLPPACVGVGRPRPAPSTQGCYLGRTRSLLAGAPAPIGFEEAVQTRQLAKRFSAASERLSSEVRQQVRRVQMAVAEKSQLEEELRALQDDHALLRSNFQVLKENGAAAAPAPSSSSSAAAAAAASAARSDLVLSSRQRALLDSLSVTAQESASLRQHGYFVEVISLTPSDVALAAGPPPPAASAADAGAADASGGGGGGSPSSASAGGGSGFGAAEAPDAASWEVAVRRVYEQQVRRLQAQIRVADAKAMELHVSVQQSLDNLRQEEQAKTLLRNDAAAAKAQLLSLQEDMAATRRNYDTQLAMLTEHICSLSTKISDKDENLAALQAKKVLCGRCGMWNVMGKLLSDDGGGMCQTCKEKVLGRA